jgi:hypothetical protein
LFDEEHSSHENKRKHKRGTAGRYGNGQHFRDFCIDRP